MDDEKYLKYFYDVKNDLKLITTRIIWILGISLAINIGIVIIFLSDAKEQRKEFMDTINKQQTEFINFLSEYDFETTFQESSTDGGGNAINNNKVGEVDGSGLSKNKNDDTKGQEVERDNNINQE